MASASHRSGRTLESSGSAGLRSRRRSTSGSRLDGLESVQDASPLVAPSLIDTRATVQRKDNGISTLLVTGGAGFIGSNLVRYLLDHAADRLVVVDKLTYAGSLLNLSGVLDDPRVTCVQVDIADPEPMADLFARHQPRALFNLAAETHVDRSIDSPRPFIDTNIV